MMKHETKPRRDESAGSSRRLHMHMHNSATESLALHVDIGCVERQQCRNLGRHVCNSNHSWTVASATACASVVVDAANGAAVRRRRNGARAAASANTRPQRRYCRNSSIASGVFVGNDDLKLRPSFHLRCDHTQRFCCYLMFSFLLVSLLLRRVDALWTTLSETLVSERSQSYCACDACSVA